MKMINISIWLYGKPSWDLPIEGKKEIDPKILKLHGEHLKKHLFNVAEILKKLKSKGWNCYGTLYTLDFSKEKTTKAEAKKELKELKIDLKLVNIEELEPKS